MYSSTTPLAANAAVTSPVFKFGDNPDRIVGSVFSDQAGTLFVEQTSDGTHWDVSSEYEIVGEDGQGFERPSVGLEWRVRYVNGGTLQTAFRLNARALGKV